MILKENYTLTNGVAIPKLGLGTWFINDKDVV
jgi:diketogulonate reductase-like aldo/keto reductase